MSERVRCRKCGFENPAGMKFCGNCGAKLTLELAPKLESLALLHITGSIYLIISLIFNALIRVSPILLISYTTSALLGLYAGYALHKNKVGRYLKIVSVLASIIGFIATFILFIMGLEIRGVVGPAWIIFLVIIYVLWKKRAEFQEKQPKAQQHIT